MNSAANVIAAPVPAGWPAPSFRPRHAGVSLAKPVPSRGHQQACGGQPQQRRRDRECQPPVEYRDDDQQPQIHHGGGEDDTGLRLPRRRLLGARPPRQHHRRGRGRIQAAQHGGHQPGTGWRDVALQQIADIRHRADRDHREPHLMRRDAGKVGHRRVRQQRQHEAGHQQEAAGIDDLAQLDAAGEAVQHLAPGQEQHGGDGRADGDPGRLGERHRPEQIGEHVADRHHQADIRKPVRRRSRRYAASNSRSARRSAPAVRRSTAPGVPGPAGTAGRR